MSTNDQRLLDVGRFRGPGDKYSEALPWYQVER